jgi:hypothetical protein
MSAQVPPQANTIVDLEDLIQTGQPSSDLTKPNYNPLIVLKGDAWHLGYNFGLQTAVNVNNATRWSVLSALDFTGGSSSVHSQSDLDLLLTAEEQDMTVSAMVTLNLWLFPTFYKPAMPKIYVTEAKGLLNGIHDAGYKFINMGHIGCINFMQDFMNCIVNANYSANQSPSDLIKTYVADNLLNDYKFLPPADQTALDWFFLNYGLKFEFLGFQDGCDAYNTCNPKNSHKTRRFTRFLQFPSLDFLFYNIVSPIARFPTDDNRRATLGWATAGMIGTYALMNENGLAIAMNYYRSQAIDITSAGFNILMIMRMLLEYNSGVDGAVKQLQNTKRGMPYFITLSDIHHTVVCELHGSGADLTHPRNYIQDPHVKEICPSNHELFKNSPKVINNVLVRTADFSINSEKFTNVNHKLFKYGGFPKTHEDIKKGNLWTTWQIEQSSLPVIGNNYYLMPIHLGHGRILQTNNALTPVARTTQMGAKSNVICEHASGLSWRYWKLSGMIKKTNSDHIDEVIDLTNYISSYTLPAYPENMAYISKHTPLDNVPLQCCSTIFTHSSGECVLKAGPWVNSWIRFSFDSARKQLESENSNTKSKPPA